MNKLKHHKNQADKSMKFTFEGIMIFNANQYTIAETEITKDTNVISFNFVDPDNAPFDASGSLAPNRREQSITITFDSFVFH